MKNYRTILGLSVFSLFVFIACTLVSLSQIPHTFSYQGTLTDQIQTPFPDGNYQLTFVLYASALGNSSVWQETHSVATVGGVFDVTLGAITPLDIAFDKQLWLGITLSGNPEMTPRTPLVATAYALYSDIATTATSLSPNATGAVLSLNGVSGKLAVVGGGKTTVTQNGSSILISSLGGIDRVEAADGSLIVNNPDGPLVSLKVSDGGISTVKLADGAVTTSKLADNAISAAKIIDGAIINSKLTDGSVTTSKLFDGAVTVGKINSTGANSGQALTFDGTKVVWGSPSINGAAGGDLTGTYPNPSITSNAITTVKLADGSVTTIKLADSSVTTIKVRDGAITTSKFNTSGANLGQALIFNGTNVVWGSPSLNGEAGGDLTDTYPNPRVAPNAITTIKLADGSVTTIKLSNGSVTTDKVADAQITSDKLNPLGATTGQSLTYNGTKVAWANPIPGGIAGGDLTGNYPNPNVGPNAITTSKLADGAVTSIKVNDGAITTAKVSSSGAGIGQALTFNGTNVVWGSPSPIGTAGGDLTGTYPNPTISTNAVTTAKILDANITTSKLADASVTNIKLSSSGAANGQALTFNGTNVVWGSPSPSGAAGGDLTGTYPNPTISTDAVTTPKILDANITTSKLADASVTNIKLSSSGAASGQALTFNGTNVVWGSPSPSGTAGGDLTGTYPNPTITTNAVTTAKILDANITTSKLADASVTNIKLSSSGAASGQALTFNGTNVVWGSPSPSGAAGGDLTGTYPNPSISTDAVTTAKILDANITTSKLADASVTNIKLNTTGAANGQALTFNGTNVVWGSPSPSGAAGGDLTGAYPNPTITTNAVTTAKILDANITTPKLADASVTNVKLSSSGAASGQALTFNGTNVVWGSPSPSGTAGGDLTGTYPNPTITTNAVTTSKLADGAVTNIKLSSSGAASGQALTFNGTNVVWGSPSPSGTAGGDLTGTYPNPTITTNAVTTAKILDANITTSKLADASVTNIKLSSSGAASGQALTFNGTNVVWGSPSPSGTAGGDLTGTYPNPTITTNAVTTAKILDANITTPKLADASVTNIKLSSSGAANGQALTFNGTNVVWGSPSPSGAAGGDLIGTYPNPTISTDAVTTAKILDANITTSKLADASVTNAKLNSTGASSGQSLTFNGTNVVWGSPSPSGTAGGDLTGTYPNPTITTNAVTTAKILDANITTSKLADASVTNVKLSSSGAASGQALTFNGTNVVWGSPSPSGAAGGDLTGTYPNPTITTNAVTTAKILDANITTSKLADASVTNVKLNSSGAASGQALTFNGTNVVWGSPSPSGTAGGDLTGTYPNPTITTNAVTTSKLADASVTNIKLSSSGAASGQALTFNGTNVVWGSPSPSGAAGGDLTGAYPNPTITTNAVTTAKILDANITTPKLADASVTNVKLNSSGAASGQALTFNGTNVVWGSPSPSGAAGGDLTGTYPNPTITTNAVTTAKILDANITTSKLADASVTNVKLNSSGAASGQALTFNGTNVVWGSPSPSGTAGGDLTGAYPNPTITTNAVTTAKILDANITTSKLADASVTNIKLSSSGAANGQALTFNGTNVVWGSPSPSGAAGGDLTGTYPNPTISTDAVTSAKILDANITTSKLADASVTNIKLSSSGAASGQALTFNGTNVVWGSPSPSGTAGGDLTGTYPNPTITTNAVTTAKILDANITTSKLADASVTNIKLSSTGAASGQALTFNGTNVVWGSPSPSGAAGGDLTGAYPNPTITTNAVTTAKILDANITTSKLADASVTNIKLNTTGAANGQALTFNGTNVVWGSPSPSGTAGGDLTGTYPNPTISTDAVTSVKILDANITTSKLADASVTNIKLNSSGAANGQALTFNGTNVVWGSPSPSGTAGGDLTGTYPNPTITTNAVTTAKILDANITTSKLADASVTNVKLNSSGAASGQALTFNGTNVVWGSPSPSLIL